MRTFLLWMGLAMLALPSFAQEKILNGVVVEETGKGKFSPIVGAGVYWLGTATGTTTDTNGVFAIRTVSGNNRLVFTYLGYRADTVTITAPDKITVVLKNSRDLAEVVIEYRTKGTSISTMNAMHVQQISKKELFKAACCNLSESFETNPSVDVAYTDAVTGTKQIQLLGLAGGYTQILQENVPTVRGLSSTYGLEFIPGAWIDGMQLSKGTGSVVNGYESIAGQLNVELHKPYEKTRLIFNGYAGQGGRYESNLVYNKRLGKKWSTSMLLHGNYRPSETDHNRDSFMDNPTGKQYSLASSWDYRDEKGVEGQFSLRYTEGSKEGGQLSSIRDTPGGRYVFSVDNDHLQLIGKLGYVFPEKKYQSMGVQLSYQDYSNQSGYGILNRYNGRQKTLYGNFIYQTIIGTSDHKVRTGISLLNDQYSEAFNGLGLERHEVVPGVFAEYSWVAGEKFSLVAGLRGDHHNLFGSFVTPRLHIRYAPKEKSIFRLSLGRGQKTANVLAENMGLMASSRQFLFSFPTSGSTTFRPEVAWNTGVSYTRHFTIDYREGYFSMDLYHTDFKDQVVADLDASAREARFYNLSGRSYSNSFQAELNYEIMKHLDLRIAYRFYDVKTDYSTGLLARPLVSRHRAFLNMGYETMNGWLFDATLSRVGSKRLPGTSQNPEQYRLSSSSPGYFLLNAQVTKKVGERLEAYAGMENITNFRQQGAIVAAGDPNGSYFDSSMVWGPVFGRMTYIGFRYTLKDLE
jgi:outer membrane receptor for ferrienterochelin and colicins